MILFIDDDPRRIGAFRKAYGSNVRTASTFVSAAAALTLHADGDLTDIWLDCDGVDGERLAVRIVAMGLHGSARFKIHSSNYLGSIQMRDTLRNAGYEVELVSFEDEVG